MLKCWSAGLVVGLIVVSSGASAQIRKAHGAYLFRVKFTKGQIIRYGIDSQVSMSKGAKPIHAGGPMSSKVLSVNGDKATLEITSGPISMNGRVLQEAKNVRVEEDTRGNVVGGTSQQIGLVFPQKAVKPGQSWDGQATLPSASGNMTKVNAHYRFIGMKTVGGHKAAQVAATFNMSSPIQAAGRGMIYFLAQDGSMLRTDMTLKSTGQPGASGPQGMSLNVRVVINRH